ncbi:hypothetical protein EV356DRAFT_525182 [Viridothelium virens]|uniref:Calcium permease family membrane transporter n=1 Tax=Viridothelium virens TaxID=1048519 RepID=A0A6A6H3B4_VIRVR|nr:hypothetical protein EV356DRAFT_525182 [Viridothelium virens]
MSRRGSHVQGPHRGQEFSVDDATSEVDEDMAQTRLARTTSNQLRRQPSTIRRRGPQAPPLSRVQSSTDDLNRTTGGGPPVGPQPETGAAPPSSSEDTAAEGDDEDAGGDDEDDGEISDAESFTLKDRQQAINETHPFGIRIWKPALYKKDRSVQKNAEGDIHSSPGGFVSGWLVLFNFLWTLLFGWWLALIAAIGGLICFIFGLAPDCIAYGRVLLGLSVYIIYPFGKFVRLNKDEAYLEEDEGEGRSISEYEQWQSGDIEEGRLFFGPPTNIDRNLVGRRRDSVDSADESASLLGRTGRSRGLEETTNKQRRRFFGRGKWTVGRVVFFIVFYGLLTPFLFLVSVICWLLVFPIPMGRVTLLLFRHLRKHPLALSFHSDTSQARAPGSPSSTILLCTYRAVGMRYWKYTIDGTNIFLINLLGIVAFVIFDYYVLDEALGLKIGITNPGFVFVLALFSIIPLAYFIGQAVASISAQSSMGVGATINAFFSTVVEVFLYCIALKEGKAQLVEGSIIGSIFAGILFLPGLSMCFGALKRKTQRFNVKSAGVTSTMLLFAIIGSFSPTLFYQIYGSHELNCHQCIEVDLVGADRDCRRCYFSQTPAIHDRFYIEAIRPYIWFAAVCLFLSYVFGLLFTLRTHAAVIWSNELDEKKVERLENSAVHMSASGHSDPHSVLTRQQSAGLVNSASRKDIRDSELYKRILGQSLKQVGLGSEIGNGSIDKRSPARSGDAAIPHLVPPRNHTGGDVSGHDRSQTSFPIPGLSEDDNHHLVRQVAEMAATAAAVATRDATRAPRKASQMASTEATKDHSHSSHQQRHPTFPDDPAESVTADTGHGEAGGHDAPNWSRTKSAVILLTATIAYAIIAEILVNTVDTVLDNVDIDEKFLGITLFALVPNTTEFLNAISFAMNGNIALSMEIGSAYALQVCLLQVPCLVLFSAVYGGFINPDDIIDHTFTLLFPQWDMVTVTLCVILLTYMYGEGKSNYFKGSILILSYLVVVLGFYFSSFNNIEVMGVDRFDTLATGRSETFKTIGQSTRGRGY